MRPIAAMDPALLWPTERDQIPQIRIELTDRCSNHCLYCRPSGEGVPASAEDATGSRGQVPMGVDEISELVRVLVDAGASDFKLTGGDPMLRQDILDIVRAIRAIPGVSQLDLVTRMASAGEMAQDLFDAGLSLLNFSLDSLDPARWKTITGASGRLDELLDAIRLAATSGMPVRVNSVILSDLNDAEVPELMAFCADVGCELKLLDLIEDVSPKEARDGTRPLARYADLLPLAHLLEREASLAEVVTQHGGLGHPMLRFEMPSGVTVTLKSSRLGAYYGSVCHGCAHFPCCDALMALRLTPVGSLQFCLLREDNMVDLMSLTAELGHSGAVAATERAMDVFRTAWPISGMEVLRLRRGRTHRSESISMRQRMNEVQPLPLIAVPETPKL